MPCAASIFVAWVTRFRIFRLRGRPSHMATLCTTVTLGPVSPSANLSWASECGTTSAASITSTRGPDVDPERIHGLGEGGAALAVLLAGVLNDSLHSLLLDRMVATYGSLVRSKAYALDFSWFLYGVLKQFDLPDLVGSLAPRRCWLLNAANAQGEPLAESAMASHYAHPIEIYKQANAGAQIRYIATPAQEKGKALESWLQTA